MAVSERRGRNRQEPVAYGACCSWWDLKINVGRAPHHPLPCCPHCYGVLYEMGSLEKWWAAAELFEQADHPGYCDYLEWAQGKCFPNYLIARATYEQEKLSARD